MFSKYKKLPVSILLITLSAVITSTAYGAPEDPASEIATETGAYAATVPESEEPSGEAIPETNQEETRNETLPPEESAPIPEESEGTRSYEENVKIYRETLRSIENENPQLSPAEEAEGYKIINGHKYSPQELAGDEPEDVIYGSVPPGPRTGYVTVRGIIPEYVHEPAYIRMFNLNNYKIYGLNLYETNGFVGDICLPSGTYIINEAGLLADSWGRFYAKQLQFNVRSGSNQTVVLEIIDSEPEEAGLAYQTASPEEQTAEEEWSEISTTASGEQAILGDNSQAETTVQEETESTAQEPVDRGMLVKRVLSALLTIIPLVILIFLYVKYSDKKGGFYD